MNNEPKWGHYDIPTIEEMIRYLESRGWTKWRGHHTVWQTPERSHIFRGPAAAYWQAKKEEDAALD